MTAKQIVGITLTISVAAHTRFWKMRWFSAHGMRAVHVGPLFIRVDIEYYKP